MSLGYGIDEYGIGTYGPDLVVEPDSGLTKLLLDPVEVSESRIALSLNAGAIRPMEEGPDWGDATIEAFMAEQAIGQVPVDYRIPNRIVRIPLLLGAEIAGFHEALRRLRAKTALLQREGGWLRRGNLYADVVNASLALPDRYEHLSYEIDVVLTLECIPEFYGVEEELTSHVEVDRSTVVFTEASIKGDFPARARLIVSEFQGQYQRGLAWAYRCRHYDTASTAQLRYRAQDLTPLGSSTLVSLAGSASPSVVRQTVGSAGWSPLLMTDITDGALTHTGSYRVFARVHTLATSAAPQFRLTWNVGDLTLPVINEGFTIYSPDQYFIADLGEVRLDPAPIGSHRWHGQVQAKGTYGNATVFVDEVWLQPLDEGAGLLRAPLTTSSYTTHIARDEFDQSAGALTGKTLPTGQTWGFAGAVGDWTVTGGTAVRAGAVDANLDSGRFAIAGSTYYGDIAVQANFTRTSPATFASGVIRQGVFCRWTDTNNYLLAVLETTFGGVPQPYYMKLLKRKAGTTYILYSALWGRDPNVRLQASTSGHYGMWVYGGSNATPPVVVGADADLATGGALAAGQHGLYEANTMTSGFIRVTDNFESWAPDADAVMYPSRSCEVRWDGMFRETNDTNRYGPVSVVEGDLARLPVGGLEQRVTEVFVKGSRGDFDRLPDSGIDNVAVSLKYRPCYLFPREES